MKEDPDNGQQQQSGLNGDSDMLSIHRGVSELRHGRFVAIVEGERALVVAALETAAPAAVERMRRFAPEAGLILTAERAAALRMEVVGPVRIAMAELPALESLRCQAGLAGTAEETAPVQTMSAWEGSQSLLGAAFRLAKAARVVPALIGVETLRAPLDDSIVRVELDSIERITQRPVPSLKRISTCRVPLADAEDSVVTLFRDPLSGAEHVAVTIGTPGNTASVPVRLHSACLTGDVLGSLRCDCGEQLQTAVRRIAGLGGGVLLYLDQEGRGIGLANKLRAYAIQDEGLDTLDADRHLGFRADERSYGVAAAMLAALDIKHIRLLTNNPHKIEALRELGIDVTGRLPLVAASNIHNERYLRAKRERAGHLSEETGS